MRKKYCTIHVLPEIHKRITAEGDKNESYNDIVTRMVDFYKFSSKSKFKDAAKD